MVIILFLGNILNPVDYSFEPKVANLIHKALKI